MLADRPVVDDLLLICSELAANAVQHSASARPGGAFIIRAEVRDGDYVWVEVEDEGGRWDGTRRSDERGRGLAVVEKVAAYWDIRSDDTGRVICARLDWPMTILRGRDAPGADGPPGSRHPAGSHRAHGGYEPEVRLVSSSRGLANEA